MVLTREIIIASMAVVRGRVSVPPDEVYDACKAIDCISRKSPYYVEDFSSTPWLAVSLLYSVGGIDLVEDYLDHAPDEAVEQEYDYLLYCIVTRNSELARRYDAADVHFMRDPVPPMVV